MSDKLTSNFHDLDHIKIPDKSFETLSNDEFASMIRALFLEHGNNEFDQWALIEFHSIKKFKSERVQGIWDVVDKIFTENYIKTPLKNLDGWQTEKGKTKLLEYAKKLGS